ncbi:ead/Ea22-like family protein [Shewanella glacialipiscicola]|uniref:ead/Ea22-like family protein n=1 Tax=Shewanella glacialipiscicola TaxID=614069 RepID=UPI003D79666E
MSQLIEYPAFLLEMSQQMHQQPSRCTAEPMWQVRCKRYLITEEGYNEHHWEIADTEDGCVLYHSDICDKTALAGWLADNDHEWCKTWLVDNDNTDIYHDVSQSFDEVFIHEFLQDFDIESNYDALPEQLKKFHLQETEEVVKTCLTEADARAFIARKQHDYPKLYTYVESMVFCPQMIELRNWIMSLTKPEVAA